MLEVGSCNITSLYSCPREKKVQSGRTVSCTTRSKGVYLLLSNLPEEGCVPARLKVSFRTLSEPTPTPSGQNDPWFSQVCWGLVPKLELWEVG